MSLQPAAVHGVSPLGVVAAAAAYTHSSPWLDGVVAHLDGDRHALTHLLAGACRRRFDLPEGTCLGLAETARRWG